MCQLCNLKHFPHKFTTITHWDMAHMGVYCIFFIRSRPITYFGSACMNEYWFFLALLDFSRLKLKLLDVLYCWFCFYSGPCQTVFSILFITLANWEMGAHHFKYPLVACLYIDVNLTVLLLYIRYCVAISITVANLHKICCCYFYQCC